MQRLPFFNYKVQNNSNGSCDLFIDGVIVDASTEQIMKDWWNDDTATSFKKIRNEIDAANPSVINIYINSGGGQVTEAMAIHDYMVSLQNKKGIRVNTYGRGIIASAATYILMCTKNSYITENSFFMIHEVSGFCYGTVSECKNQLTILTKFNDLVTNFYVSHTGIEEKKIGNMMKDETWMPGNEAADKGFVKNLEPSIDFTNEIEADQWIFNNTDVLSAYNSFTPKFKNMDLKSIQTNIENAIKKALNELGITPKNDAQTAVFEVLNTSIENALKPLTEEIDTVVTNKVTEAINAVTTGLPALITNAITAANVATTEGVNALLKPISDEMEIIKTDVANKIGGEKKEKPKNEAPGKFEHDGIEFKDK